MEPGGEDDHASYEAWMRLGATELIDCRRHHLGTGFSKWHSGGSPPTQPTWRRLIQLLLGYEGKAADLDSVRTYQQDKWGTLEGDTASLEVSALHARGYDTTVNRTAYREERIKVLKERLGEWRPKIVVFYGQEYRAIYESISDACFDAQGFAWHGETLCVLVRHPTGRSNPAEMKKGEWWAAKGREMRIRFETGNRNCPTLERDKVIQRPLPIGEHEPLLENETDLDHKAEYSAGNVIRILIRENPKRGKSRLRFDCYNDGITFLEYENAVRQRLGDAEARKCKDDLKWDRARRFIRIEDDSTG